jgi:hypothetical protein
MRIPFSPTSSPTLVVGGVFDDSYSNYHHILKGVMSSLSKCEAVQSPDVRGILPHCPA